VKPTGEAIKQFSGEKLNGSYERSADAVAVLLGVSANTVDADRAALNAQVSARGGSTARKQLPASDQSSARGHDRQAAVDERRKAVARMTREGPEL
jgi:hypothetical protein